MPYTLSSFSKPRTGGRTCTCSHLGWEESTCAAAPIRGASERTRPEFGCWPGSASTTLAMLVDAPLARAACAAAPCNALLACATTKAHQGTVNYASYVHATTCLHEVHVNHMPTVCQMRMLQHACIQICAACVKKAACPQGHWTSHMVYRSAGCGELLLGVSDLVSMRYACTAVTSTCSLRVCSDWAVQ